MKNKLYITGIVCVLLIVTGCLFKVSHWPGASILLSIGVCSFTLIFMPFALRNSYKTEKDTSIKTLYLISYICIFVVCIGALLKVQNWPGSSLFLKIGTPLPFVLFLPTYIYQIQKSKQLNYNNLLLVLFFFAYFAIITALLSINVSTRALDEYVMSSNNFDTQTQVIKAQSQEILNNLTDSRDSLKKTTISRIQNESATIYKLIDNIITGIVCLRYEQNKHLADSKGILNLWVIPQKDDRYVSSNEIFLNKADTLRASIIEFKGLLLRSIDPKKSAVIDLINHDFNIHDNWQAATFGGKRLIAIIETLSSIKHAIALTELETITAIEQQ